MRILTRYVLREVVSYALLGGALFTFVLFVGRLGRIVDLVVRDSASLGQVARIFGYLLPDALTMTIPMAVLVGILLGLSRLAADSEITAMRACGMSALDFVRIVSIVALLAVGVGLVNSLYLAPRSARALLALEEELKTTQASFEVQPRVFYEDFKNIVLYVQDVRPAAGAAVWRHVFVADLTKTASPSVTTADSAVVVSGPDDTGTGQTVRMHLQDGGQHQVSAANPDQYDISTFATTDLPLQPAGQDETHVSRMDAPLLALPLKEVYGRAFGGDGKKARLYRIELNRRFSYPFACLVLMLVGVPLGLSSKRGGKSTGFVLTILLVFLYYFLSSVGVALAKQEKLGPIAGVWGANVLFAVVGLVLLGEMSRGGAVVDAVAGLGGRLAGLLPRGAMLGAAGAEQQGETLRADLIGRVRRVRSMLRIRFPLLLDEYVMREFGKNFGLVLLALATVFLIFTFFDLVGDIIRNRTAVVTVANYLLNLLPFILDRVVPICSLVAGLLTFGTLNRTSELTAMKATGISVYRIIAPVLVLTLAIAGGLFAFDELYLPAANRRQEALRSVIKGKPAQTFLRPERKWISGQSSGTAGGIQDAEPARIFYYQFFDPDKDVFANLTVFEFQPASFNLQRRIFAASARWDGRAGRWVFDNGWERTFLGETVGTYQRFTIATFPEIRELPGYFKKEDLQSQEMSYGELGRYIDDLKQSGFDTMRLRVQMNHKLAYPLATFIMALLGIPFALSVGKRGGLAGMGTAIGIAMLYWMVASTFEAMGNVNTLPPVLAAWSPDVLFGLAGSYLLLRVPT